MKVSSVSNFLLHMAAVDMAAFGHPLTSSEWQILLVLGKEAPAHMRPGENGLSYKSLKCTCELSDDALSRGLRRLVGIGLIERENSERDQRVAFYRLSSRGRSGMVIIGHKLLQQTSQLIADLIMPSA
ncbi:MAG: Winged helix DNA-binding domain [Pseudomonadota bacterium]|jgi:DNA-binding MarR family transcriptional regulator